MIIFALLVLAYIAYLWFTRFEIPDKVNGGLYLRRFLLIRTKHFKLFLHRIYKPDSDRHLHNHPWSKRSGSIILCGGYEELRNSTMVYPCYTQSHRCGDVMRLASEDYHRITVVLPNTWTLFFAGKRDREWGFLVDGKHVDWRTYLGLPEDTDLGD